MTSQDERPEVTVTVDVPSCSLTRDDILKLVARIEESADWGERSYGNIEVRGRDYSVSGKKGSQLAEFDWPSPLTHVSVSVIDSSHEGNRRVQFSASEGFAEVVISHSDAVWVRGVAEQFKEFFKQRRNVHQVLGSWVVGVAVGVSACLLIFGGVALGLFAADGDIYEKSRTARLLAVLPPLQLSPVIVGLVWILMGWLFPHVEFEPVRPTRRTVRRLMAWVGGTLMLGLLLNLVGSALWLLVG